MIIKITPCPAPRQVRRDIWNPSPAVKRYRAFRDELFLKYQHHLPIPCKLLFTLEMPKGWSKKKKEQTNGKPHLSTPDLDNLVKATIDALLKQDSHVWSFHAEKHWGYEGSIEITELA